MYVCVSWWVGGQVTCRAVHTYVPSYICVYICVDVCMYVCRLVFIDIDTGINIVI